MIKDFGYQNKYHADSETGYITNSEFDFCDTNGHHYHRDFDSIKFMISNSGYAMFNYRDKNNKTVCKYVHRVIASLFCCNDDSKNKTSVDHINCDKKCNKASNLEWVTPLENSKRSSENGLINKDSLKRKRQAPLNAKKGGIKNWVKIIEYDEHGNFVRVIANSKGIKWIGRVQYKGKYYKNYDDVISYFGKIPQKITVIPKIGLSYKNSPYYIERTTKDGNMFKYETIKEAMLKTGYKREALMKKLNLYCSSKDEDRLEYKIKK